MIHSLHELTGRYMKQQYRRTLLNMLGVLMSVALLTGASSIQYSMKQQMIESAVRRDGSYHVAFKNVSRIQASYIRGHVHVEQSCYGTVAGYGVLSETGDETIPYRLLRICQNDRQAMEMLRFDALLSKGHLPENPGEIALDETTMKILGPEVQLGTQIILPVGQRRRSSDNRIVTDYFYPLSLKEDEKDSGEYFLNEEEQTFRVCGVLKEDIHLSENYSSRGLIMGEPAGVTEEKGGTLYVLLKDLTDVRGAAEGIADDIGLEKSNIIYNHRLLNALGRSLDKDIRDGMSGFRFIVAAIIIAATIAVIYNSFNIALIERITQLGMLRCIGASPSQIRHLILREAGVICLIAIPPGVFLGLFSVRLVFLAGDLMSSYSLVEGVVPTASPGGVAFSVLLCLSAVFFSAFFPAWKAGSLPPIEAVGRTGMYHQDKRARVRPFRVRLMASSFIPLMAFRYISRNRTRFLVTLFSMVISVTLFVSFGGMLRLLKRSYLISESSFPGFKLESEGAFVEEAVLRELADLEGVDLVIPYAHRDVNLLVPEDALSSPYRKYVENLPQFERLDNLILLRGSRILCYGDRALDRLGKQYGLSGHDGVLLVGVSSFCDGRGKTVYAPNSRIVPGESVQAVVDGKTLGFSIGAVLDREPFGNFNEKEGGWDLIVREDLFHDLTGRAGFRELYIRMIPHADKGALTAYLDQLVYGRVGYSYIDTQAWSEEMVQETQVASLFFYGFIGVIVLISCLNIINTICTNLLLRSREFGILQAVGLDRAGLRKMFLMECVLYSALALFIGGTIGMGLWYLLVRQISQIRLSQFTVPWREIALSAGGLTGISLLAGALSLRKSSRTDILENNSE